MNRFDVAFLGTNGSCAYNNGDRSHFGTNSLCTVLRAGNTTLIFDAGSGISGFGNLEEFHSQNRQVHLFFSHYHIDHMHGLLFWEAPFDPQVRLTMYGQGDVKQAIDCFHSEPYQPVGLREFNATLSFQNISAGDELTINNEVKIKTMEVSHPNGCLAYRAEYDGKSFCYATDIEIAKHKDDNSLIEFISGADLLVADSTFADGRRVSGWGHSTPSECATLAAAANVKKLALYHYDYEATDEDIMALATAGRKIFANTFASYDGLILEL